jgi:hypothetical protein
MVTDIVPQPRVITIFEQARVNYVMALFLLLFSRVIARLTRTLLHIPLDAA